MDLQLSDVREKGIADQQVVIPDGQPEAFCGGYDTPDSDITVTAEIALSPTGLYGAARSEGRTCGHELGWRG
jgi:hypothetical protein